MEILASVRFNQGKAYVVSTTEDYKYYRLGSNIIYGTDGVRYQCYKYEQPYKNSKAFGGRKFTLKIEDTEEIIECHGQWWDGGYTQLEKELELNLVSFTHSTIENLLKCYVYTSCFVDMESLNNLLKDKELFYYDYYDYEKVINYKSLQTKYFKLSLKYDRTMKAIKKQFKKYAPLKKQILLNYK